ncbi:unnamed protein product, partial [Iphiclides podalirius]
MKPDWLKSGNPMRLCLEAPLLLDIPAGTSPSISVRELFATYETSRGMGRDIVRTTSSALRARQDTAQPVRLPPPTTSPLPHTGYSVTKMNQTTRSSWRRKLKRIHTDSSEHQLFKERNTKGAIGWCTRNKALAPKGPDSRFSERMKALSVGRDAAGTVKS